MCFVDCWDYADCHRNRVEIRRAQCCRYSRLVAGAVESGCCRSHTDLSKTMTFRCLNARNSVSVKLMESVGF